MDKLLNKLSEKVKGVITGFDRIVFKGMLRPMMYAAGMQNFLQSKKILNKDFKDYAMNTSKAIVQSAEEISKKECDDNYSNPEILSRANIWYDGLRVRHWNEKNSVKFYNEHNVLRFEMTMNDLGKYKIHRHAENQDKAEPKKLMPIRKGIADISVRAEVSKNIVNRFSDHMSTTEEKTPIEELLTPVSAPIKKKDKKVRSIDVVGKDLELLRAISDPVFDVSPITNKELQTKLKDTSWAKGMQGKQLAGRISRHISLLREHGLIKKIT